MDIDLQHARAAAEAAGKQAVFFGQRTGSTMTPSGYVLVDPGASDEEISNAVFEAKYGRPIDDRERLLMDLSERARAES